MNPNISNDSQLNAVEINNEIYYKISALNTMRTFFMSIVSDSNHWLFVSSNGGISAGRKNAQFALFPYYTDDKITESAEITGSKTMFKIEKNGNTFFGSPSLQKMRVNTIKQIIYTKVSGAIK